VSSAITIATALDSWGVWFPGDPDKVAHEVFLREVAEAPLLEAVVDWAVISKASSSTTSIRARQSCRCPSPSGPMPISARAL
jgi:hypothetical protein